MHKYLIYFTLPLVLLLIGCSIQSHIPQSLLAEVHTFVIVHGAWGGGWAFREVDDMLTAQGHKVYRPTLTGQGERVHLASKDVGLETHIDDVVNTILYEELNDIILVGHSYGGMVVTGVADRIPERISHLIYLDATTPVKNIYRYYRSQKSRTNGYSHRLYTNCRSRQPTGKRQFLPTLTKSRRIQMANTHLTSRPQPPMVKT